MRPRKRLSLWTPFQRTEAKRKGNKGIHFLIPIQLQQTLPNFWTKPETLNGFYGDVPVAELCKIKISHFKIPERKRDLDFHPLKAHSPWTSFPAQPLRSGATHLNLGVSIEAISTSKGISVLEASGEASRANEMGHNNNT